MRGGSRGLSKIGLVLVLVAGLAVVVVGLVVVVLGGLIALGASGSGGGAADTPAMTPTATPAPAAADGPTPTATPAATATATATATASPTATAQPTTHGMGETFTVGTGNHSLQYAVSEVETADTVGEGYGEEEANGEFVVVHLSIEHVGSEPATLRPDMFTLVDGEGREAEPKTEAYLAMDSSIQFEELNPGITVEGTVVFDVPTDQSERRLQIDPAGMFSTADAHTVELSE